MGNVNGGVNVGGLVGYDDGYLSNSYSTCDIVGQDHVGGLVGVGDIGNVSDCYSTGDVTGTGYNIGGLVGIMLGYVSNSYSTGNVNGGVNVGGLMGWIEGSISNSYSTGNVSGTEVVGGLVGINGWEFEGWLTHCYSTGSVVGDVNVGGLIGTNCNNGNASNCFWDIDIQTHGVAESIGDNQGTATNVYGLPTSQLHQQSTFTDWDFINVWNIGENQIYPYLRVYLPSDINKDGIVNFLDVAITANQWMEGVE
jgi:hypothetical protein